MYPFDDPGGTSIFPVITGHSKNKLLLGKIERKNMISTYMEKANTLQHVLEMFLGLNMRAVTLTPNRIKRLKKISNCRLRERNHYCDKEFSITSTYLEQCRERSCPICSRKGKMKDSFRDFSLSPVGSFLTFKIPEAVCDLGLDISNQKLLYNVLFESVALTLKTLMKNREPSEFGSVLGLHTQGKYLSYQPHVHAIVCGIEFDSQIEKHARDLFKDFCVKNLRKMIKKFNYSTPKNTNALADHIEKLTLRKYEMFREDLKRFSNSYDYITSYGMTKLLKDHEIKFNPDNRKITLVCDRDDSNHGEKSFDLETFVMLIGLHMLPYGMRNFRVLGFFSNNWIGSNSKNSAKHLEKPVSSSWIHAINYHKEKPKKNTMKNCLGHKCSKFVTCAGNNSLENDICVVSCTQY